ncbi:MAG: LD-carboxypeptidase [Ignavibacteria bacterium]|nr:LD-carboxypeptidase [Ignavibacteria bacterium]
MNRPTFLRSLALTGLFARAILPATTGFALSTILKPRRLQPGDTVGLVNPAGATFQTVDIEIIKESLQALGLQVLPGDHVLDRYGYLAGKDSDRAEDVNRMFADPSVKALLCVRGGWGSNRILPLLDYECIRKNPKIIMGYSDATSLLVALYAECGLVTFHGPVGISTWNSFSTDYVKRILMEGESAILRNPATPGDTLAQTKDRIEVITPGRARGRCVGGNLSVLASMIGSPYLPDWEHHILFLEETDEQIYRVDRMLTQLKLAGILGKLAGVVFGKCTNCGPGEGYGSLTLEEVFRDHIKPLGVPAWSGAMIGHIENKFTIPIGIEVEIDAQQGTIQMLEPAVQ